MKVKKIIALFSFILVCGIILEGATFYFLNKNLHQIFFTSNYQKLFLDGSFSYWSNDCEKAHQERRVKGLQVMKKSKVVFAGLARNIEDTIPVIIQRIESTAGYFNEYRVVVFENDSEDKTRELLKKWEQKNKQVHLLTCPEHKDCKLNDLKMYDYGSQSKKRISKMAAFRNRYLQFIKNNYHDYDYLIVLDLDLQGPWSLNGLADSFGYNDWDAIFACGLHSLIGTYGNYLVMYDGMAYVGFDEIFNTKINPFKNYFKMNFIDGLGLPSCRGLVPVKSSFSGMALYKISSLKNAYYSAQRLCEHIALHEMIYNNGHQNLFVNPKLQLLSGHQGPPNILQFIVDSFYQK